MNATAVGAATPVQSISFVLRATVDGITYQQIVVAVRAIVRQVAHAASLLPSRPSSV
jgi:hypothetical protein